MTYTKRELYGNAKLTDSDVRAIRLRGRSEHPRALAREYNVAPDTIRKVLRWDTYANVSEEGPGATIEDWNAPADPGAVAASLARLQAKLGPSAQSSGAMPSMEASLAAAAKESDEVAARLAKQVDEVIAREDSLLAGLLDPNGIQSTITPAQSGTSTDGGSK